MPFTIEHYETITDKLDSDAFYELTDLAHRANSSSYHNDFDKLYELAKNALDYDYGNESKDALESLLDEISGVSGEVLGAIEALEKIEDVLSKAENVLTDVLYAEEFEDD